MPKLHHHLLRRRRIASGVCVCVCEGGTEAAMVERRDEGISLCVAAWCVTRGVFPVRLGVSYVWDRCRNVGVGARLSCYQRISSPFLFCCTANFECIT